MMTAVKASRTRSRTLGASTALPACAVTLGLKRAWSVSPCLQIKKRMATAATIIKPYPTDVQRNERGAGRDVATPAVVEVFFSDIKTHNSRIQCYLDREEVEAVGRPLIPSFFT